MVSLFEVDWERFKYIYSVQCACELHIHVCLHGTQAAVMELISICQCSGCKIYPEIMVYRSVCK